MENQLIKLIWAIRQTVEIDSYAIEEIANQINMDQDDIIELFDTCEEIYNEQKATRDIYDDFCSDIDTEDDDDEYLID